jgi:hypothetical protein
MLVIPIPLVSEQRLTMAAARRGMALSTFLTMVIIHLLDAVGDAEAGEARDPAPEDPEDGAADGTDGGRDGQ